MNNLIGQTENSSAVIIFNDRSKINITANQKELLFSELAVKTGKVIIDGQLYQMSSISKVLDINEYYSQYPEQVPETRRQFNIEEVKPMTEEGIKNMRRGLMKGLKGFIDEELAKGITPHNAIAIYKKGFEKYQNIYQVLEVLK